MRRDAVQTMMFLEITPGLQPDYKVEATEMARSDAARAVGDHLDQLILGDQVGLSAARLVRGQLRGKKNNFRVFAYTRDGRFLGWSWGRVASCSSSDMLRHFSPAVGKETSFRFDCAPKATVEGE